MKIAALNGSNSKNSYNLKLLNFIKRHFKDQDIDVYPITGLPMFNENYPGGTPQSVLDLAKKIGDADAVIIAVAEYNHSLTSALKSVMEWFSYQVHPLTKKPVLLVGTTSHDQGASRAQVHLRDITLSPGIYANVFQGNEFFMGREREAFDADGNIKDPNTVKFLEQVFSDFLTFAKNNPAPKKADGGEKDD